MTRKDYKLIAETIATEAGRYDLDSEANSVLYGLAELFALKLANENPRFSRTRFLEACGLE